MTGHTRWNPDRRPTTPERRERAREALARRDRRREEAICRRPARLLREAPKSLADVRPPHRRLKELQRRDDDG